LSKKPIASLVVAGAVITGVAGYQWLQPSPQAPGTVDVLDQEFEQLISQSDTAVLPQANTVHPGQQLIASVAPAFPRPLTAVPVGVQQIEAEQYCNKDATSGRTVELIQQRQPASMLCHWPGMYCNGTQEGFEQFKVVVKALNRTFSDNIVWMKVSEIATYWAAKETLNFQWSGNELKVTTQHACPELTLKLEGRYAPANVEQKVEQTTELKRVSSKSNLVKNSFYIGTANTWVCFDKVAGTSQLALKEVA